MMKFKALLAALALSVGQAHVTLALPVPAPSPEPPGGSGVLESLQKLFEAPRYLWESIGPFWTRLNFTPVVGIAEWHRSEIHNYRGTLLIAKARYQHDLASGMGYYARGVWSANGGPTFSEKPFNISPMEIRNYSCSVPGFSSSVKAGFTLLAYMSNVSEEGWFGRAPTTQPCTVTFQETFRPSTCDDVSSLPQERRLNLSLNRSKPVYFTLRPPGSNVSYDPLPDLNVGKKGAIDDVIPMPAPGQPSTDGIGKPNPVRPQL